MKERITEECSDPSLFQRCWLKMWNLNIPPKVKFFVWRLCNNALPSLSNLLVRKVVRDVMCPKCGQNSETVGQALWWCAKSAEVWVSTPFWESISKFKGLGCEVVLRGLSECLKADAVESICMVLWGIWQSRNVVVHKGNGRSTASILEGSFGLLQDFQASKKLSRLLLSLLKLRPLGRPHRLGL
ncbi:hypothetical protein Q3G72_004632 [Acer saccharum]|nr:hypothetical protein Q3G72_004632 [Acer saccharum]